MELTSKQRAQLRGLASTLDTIIHIGKDGISDNLVKQADDALEATRSEVVQVIGNKFVLYRMQRDKTKRKIELVKAPRRSV